MRGNAARRPDKQISAAQAKAQLAMLLAGATDERLFAFKAAELSRMTRVQDREVECMLSAAQAKRRREIAARG